MKYIRQFLIILSISFIGEVLRMLLPLPIPASIYGMVILFLLLISGKLKLESVKEAGKLLIEAMPVMFIPAGVGLISTWNILSPLIVQVLIITVLTLILVMACSGLITQWVIRNDKNTGKDNA